MRSKQKHEIWCSDEALKQHACSDSAITCSDEALNNQQHIFLRDWSLHTCSDEALGTCTCFSRRLQNAPAIRNLKTCMAITRMRKTTIPTYLMYLKIGMRALMLCVRLCCVCAYVACILSASPKQHSFVIEPGTQLF